MKDDGLRTMDEGRWINTALSVERGLILGFGGGAVYWTK
jgi:hypothetical protein